MSTDKQDDGTGDAQLARTLLTHISRGLFDKIPSQAEVTPESSPAELLYAGRTATDEEYEHVSNAVIPGVVQRVFRLACQGDLYEQDRLVILDMADFLIGQEAVSLASVHAETWLGNLLAGLRKVITKSNLSYA